MDAGLAMTSKADSLQAHPSSTFLFYDIETTGLNKCFDQVLEFAAIRTDLDFNELERYEWHVKLNPDTWPAPEALITHRIPQQRDGITELEALINIHALFNTPGTRTLGYNTLGFDDEFLRFSFFRHLLPPYTHQYANACYRLDLYPVTLQYALFKPALLQWPITPEGKRSLKLEALCAANQLAEGQAHRALFDVEVTIALAKRLRAAQDMWDYVLAAFQKSQDTARIARLPFSFQTTDMSFQEALAVHAKLGHDNSFQSIVMSLGQHQHYRNQTLWLRLDAGCFETCSATELIDNSRVLRKRMGEPPFLLPTHTRFLTQLSSDRLALIEKNKVFLRENPKQCQALIDYHQHFQYPEVPHADIDAQLYMLPFTTPEEERFYQQWHRATPPDKVKLLDRFTVETRQRQALRLIGRYWPAHLTEYWRIKWREDTAQYRTAVDYRGEPKETREATVLRAQTLLETKQLDPEQQQILREFLATSQGVA